MEQTVNVTQAASEEIRALGTTIPVSELAPAAVKILQKWLAYVDDVAAQRPAIEAQLAHFSAVLSVVCPSQAGRVSQPELAANQRGGKKARTDRPIRIRHIARRASEAAGRAVTIGEIRDRARKDDPSLAHVESSIVSAAMQYGVKIGQFEYEDVGKDRVYRVVRREV